MPGAATVTAPSQPAAAPAQGTAPVIITPFTQASWEHAEPAPIDVSTLVTVNTAQLGPYSVPAFGFLRSVLLLVEATGGVGSTTAAAFRADAPWTAIATVQLTDLNGSPLVLCTGYQLFLINKYGGYQFQSDPTVMPEYVTPATPSGNFSYMLRVPVEIGRRDALGALPNQNASAQYQLSVIQAGSADTYSQVPVPTLPTIRLRAWGEMWAPPAVAGPDGSPQAVQPPATGTVQFWSRYTFPLNSGQNIVQFRRVGNLIRNIVLVFRDTSTPAVRSNTVRPDPMRLSWDGRVVFNGAASVYAHWTRERYDLSPDTGIVVLDLTHDFDGHPGGGEMRDLYYRTAQSTRLEIDGTFGAAGTVEVLINDIAPAANVALS